MMQEQISGIWPNNTINNPKEQVNTISLRSGVTQESYGQTNCRVKQSQNQFILCRSIHAISSQFMAQSLHETNTWRDRIQGEKIGAYWVKEA